MSKTLNLKIASAQNFISFLKKFNKIDSNALIEFTTDDKIRSNAHTAAKTSTKYGAIPIEDVFEVDDRNELTEPIKMGIYNIDRFITNLENILIDGTDNLVFTLEYSKTKDGDLFGEKFIIANEYTQIEYSCAAKNLFKWIPDEILNKITDTEVAEYSFEISPEVLARIKSFCDVETGSDVFISPYLEEAGNTTILFKGKNFKRRTNLTNEIFKYNNDYSKLGSLLKKEFLKFLDKEYYKVFVTPVSYIFESRDSEFKIVLSKSTEDDED